MALSPTKKEKLRELELNRGGVAFVSEKSAVTPTPTVLISLGGLGARTLNTLKGKFVREIGESDHIYFRVVDTAVNEFDDICKVKSDGSMNDSPVAFMEREETIPIYSPDIAQILMSGTIDPNIKSWINGALIGTELDSSGAQQTRQIGRAMLVNSTSYNSLRTKLNTVILDAISKRSNDKDNVDVIIVAGISGGTGSGSIIDVSYMVHDIFHSSGCTSYKLAGYIFTPDAQFRVPTIASSPAIMQNLKKNGYAALKEIDYFMNIEETSSVYELAVGDSKFVTSSKNIFNSCTLISGYSASGGLNELSVTIGRLTDQLMDMLTDIKIVQQGVSKQMSASIMSNEHAMLQSWFEQHTPRRIYHRYASYKYQVLGYNSIVIPRDEILAYCVNKIYQGVLTEFKDFKKVSSDMLKKVFQQTSINNPNSFTQFALTVIPDRIINRNINLDSKYTKGMIKNDPMVAYTDAEDEADRERAKINPAYQTLLEDRLFQALKREVDNIFDLYGPFVALKVIEHKHDELSVGNPNDPFPGILEELTLLSDAFQNRSNECNTTRKTAGLNAIKDEAANVTGTLNPLGGAERINEYVRVCCEHAVTTRIDVFLFQTLSNVLHNVRVKLIEYNNQLFDVYTSILTEVQNLLNKDGQYFSQGVTQTDGQHTTFSVDIIKDGTSNTNRLERYLDNFISKVSVHGLAQNFIRHMRDNKEKWLAQNNDNDFDVVSEVRELMDVCLTNNQMRNDIIEKFVTVAYSQHDITPEQLDAMWDDDSPQSPKTIALTSAANAIYQLLTNGAQPMANSSSVLPLNTFTKNFFISTLAETPRLTQILSGMIVAQQGFTPASSNSKTKFIYTQQYMSIPMYILLGMDEYNQVYQNYSTPGRHMDENNENWGRFPNPYTIDSVARDLNTKGRPAQDIKTYSDYQYLMDVKQKTEDGIDKYQFIRIADDGNGQVELILNDITSKPDDMEGFKEALYQELIKKKMKVDVIEFMKEHGFVIHPVAVTKGQTDIDLSLMNFDDATEAQRTGIYHDIPVPVPDVYKWLRKSIKYMDILDKSTEIFEGIQSAIDKAQKDIQGKSRYIDAVEIFAFALRTGMVKRNENNDRIWNYMDGKEPVSVNLGRAKGFDKQYYLYYVFTSFYSLEDKRLEEYRARAEKQIDDGREVDCSEINDHIREVLDSSCLGDLFNRDDINETAADQGVTDHYEVTDRPEDKGNPYNVLVRFYELIKTSL